MELWLFIQSPYLLEMYMVMFIDDIIKCLEFASNNLGRRQE